MKKRKRPKAKYEYLVEWIDRLPFDKEFNFAEAGMAVGLSKQGVRNILLMCVKNGRLEQLIVGWRTRFYKKTALWDKDKIIVENRARLKEKWAYYKPSK